MPTLTATRRRWRSRGGSRNRATRWRWPAHDRALGNGPDDALVAGAAVTLVPCGTISRTDGSPPRLGHKMSSRCQLRSQSSRTTSSPMASLLVNGPNGSTTSVSGPRCPAGRASLLPKSPNCSPVISRRPLRHADRVADGPASWSSRENLPAAPKDTHVTWKLDLAGD
jgi:hypothetical protein